MSTKNAIITAAAVVTTAIAGAAVALVRHQHH